MDYYVIFLQVLHALIPALAGGTIIALMIGFLLRGVRSESLTRTASEETFIYDLKVKKLMPWCGALFLVFALGAFVMVGFSHYGSGPLFSLDTFYSQREDWLGALIMFVFFLPWCVICVVDPFKFFIKINENEVTVRGMFTGVRSCAWMDVQSIKDHPGLQMISILGQSV